MAETEPKPEAKQREKKWYVVHTYSGFENKAKKSLEERIRLENMTELFGEILIPTEQVVEMVKGEKRTTKRKFFPGYILEPEKIPSITDAEVGRLTMQISEGTLKPKPKVQFETGDNVRVTDGPFSNFNGTVEEVDAAKGRVKVLVSIFGRATPVELDFMQVEKT
jgi:transcriptional antiterminator NusG